MLVKERNKTPIKDKNIKLRVAFVYPNKYKAGMSSYAVHLIHSLFNSYDGIICERFFFPEKTKIPLYQEDNKSFGFDSKLMKSMDSGSNLLDFDIIAFTLQYELDYLNILWIIDSLGIPFLCEERAINEEKNYPILIGGGPCSRANPLPMLKFLDIITFGDLEPIINEFISYFSENIKNLSNFNKIIKKSLETKNFEKELLKLSRLPNTIISLLAINYLENNTAIRGNNSFNSIFPIERANIEKLSESIPPIKQIIPEFKNPMDQLVFGETYLLELNRGCPYSCRFCLTGHLNRPFRNRPINEILNIIDEGIKETNVGKITLIGSSIADHPNFKEICEYIIEKKKIQLMIPSIRINKLSEDLLDILVKAGIKSLTVAPETGSEALRYSLNKRLKDDMIIDKCNLIFSKGFNSIKFYFLVGLPFETEADIEAIPSLMKKIYERFKNQIGKDGLKLSINCFIPKLFTPFGSYTKNFIDKTAIKSLKNIKKKLENELKTIPNLVFDFMDIKNARIQTILSQIDWTFFNFLFQFYLEGAKPVAIDKLDKILDYKISNFLRDTNNQFNENLSEENMDSFLYSNQSKSVLKIANLEKELINLKTELIKAKKV
ncbi:MAG: radical SAM protein [archaeon]|nr:radical SAM protein [archaeon]